ncbi:MAG: exo-alpha-sialidase [Proteobacteria bacterium]|nr:MAG: exo-alpha-sialidase [Pseudomonadota bacterium]
MKANQICLFVLMTLLVVAFQNCTPFQTGSLLNVGDLSSTGAGLGTGPGWHSLKVGAGGFLTGLDIANDGTKVVRADTYGAYVWNESSKAWKQLVTESSMPVDDRVSGSHSGVYEIRIAPAQSNRFYMSHGGFVYVSDDRGSHWQKTSFNKVSMNANSLHRVHGPRIAVDPLNPDVVYVGTDRDGLFTSYDKGATFNIVNAVPTSLQKSGEDFGVTGIVVDPSGGNLSGRSKRVFASSYGHGVYVSNDAGMTWARTSGGPSSVQRAVVDADGNYYATDADDRTENFWIYRNGAWTNLPTSGGPYHSVTLDLSRTGRIILAQAGGVLNISLDSGQTWTGNWWPAYSPATMGIRIALDLPALGETAGAWMSNGDMIIDPKSQEIFFAEGTGVWKTKIPDQMGAYAWTSQSAGIEQLVANKILVPPGGSPIVASWDRPIHHLSDLMTYPASYGPGADFSAAWGLDYASSSPTFVVGLINWGGVDKSGFSVDGGKTWSQFPGKPTALTAGVQGGCIAASTPLNIVISPSGDTLPSYTKDGGVTWTEVSLPGQTGTDGFSWAYYFKREIVAADRVTIGTFYLYSYKLGLLKSMDGGATWNLARAGEIGNFTGYNAKLKSVPSKAGHLFFTAGSQTAATHPAGNAFYRSTDGGSTFTQVPNLSEIYDFAFGAAAPGSDYPAIYIAGWVNNVWGIYRSDDNAATWEFLGANPNGNLDTVVSLEADARIYGRVYVGFSGSGYAYLNK